MVEATDLIFAVDSIPAILAISSDPFIVYTSNVFAILGLRSLYFAVAGLVVLFHHLKYGLSAILVFVGAKMLLADIYKDPNRDRARRGARHSHAVRFCVRVVSQEEWIKRATRLRLFICKK